jgi:hypothetical protein
MVPGLIRRYLRGTQEPGANICEIPHLAKNERDIGHPAESSHDAHHGLVALSIS